MTTAAGRVSAFQPTNVTAIPRPAFVVVAVFDGGKTRISSSTNVDDAFRQWTHRHGAFLPVAVMECNPVVFADAAGFDSLPVIIDTATAAKLFRLAPIAPAAQFAVNRHLRRLGIQAAGLLHEWRRAVDATIE